MVSLANSWFRIWTRLRGARVSRVPRKSSNIPLTQNIVLAFCLPLCVGSYQGFGIANQALLALSGHSALVKKQRARVPNNLSRHIKELCVYSIYVRQ